MLASESVTDFGLRHSSTASSDAGLINLSLFDDEACIDEVWNIPQPTSSDHDDAPAAAAIVVAAEGTRVYKKPRTGGTRADVTKEEWVKHIAHVVVLFDDKIDGIKEEMSKKSRCPRKDDFTENNLFTEGGQLASKKSVQPLWDVFGDDFNFKSIFAGAGRPSLPKSGSNGSSGSSSNGARKQNINSQAALKKAFVLLLRLIWCPEPELEEEERGHNRTHLQAEYNNLKTEKKIITNNHGDEGKHLAMAMSLLALYWNVSHERDKALSKVRRWQQNQAEPEKHVSVLMNMMYVFCCVLLNRIDKARVLQEKAEEATAAAAAVRLTDPYNISVEACIEWTKKNIPSEVRTMTIMQMMTFLSRESPLYGDALPFGCVALYIIVSKTMKKLGMDYQEIMKRQRQEDGEDEGLRSLLHIEFPREDLWCLLRQIRRSAMDPNCKNELPLFGKERLSSTAKY